MSKQISQGSRTVVILGSDGAYSARLYVNCTNGQLGDATLVARKFKSLKGAEQWARKVMA